MLFFFFKNPATTEIYPLSLRDALPICHIAVGEFDGVHLGHRAVIEGADTALTFEPHPRAVVAPEHAPRLLTSLSDRKSTRLNSSHANISYAVFCLKKKKTKYSHTVCDQ